MDKKVITFTIILSFLCLIESVNATTCNPTEGSCNNLCWNGFLSNQTDFAGWIAGEGTCLDINSVGNENFYLIYVGKGNASACQSYNSTFTGDCAFWIGVTTITYDSFTVMCPSYETYNDTVSYVNCMCSFNSPDYIPCESDNPGILEMNFSDSFFRDNIPETTTTSTTTSLSTSSTTSTIVVVPGIIGAAICAGDNVTCMIQPVMGLLDVVPSIISRLSPIVIALAVLSAVVAAIGAIAAVFVILPYIVKKVGEKVGHQLK